MKSNKDINKKETKKIKKKAKEKQRDIKRKEEYQEKKIKYKDEVALRDRRTRRTRVEMLCNILVAVSRA